MITHSFCLNCTFKLHGQNAFLIKTDNDKTAESAETYYSDEQNDVHGIFS